MAAAELGVGRTRFALGSPILFARLAANRSGVAGTRVDGGIPEAHIQITPSGLSNGRRTSSPRSSSLNPTRPTRSLRPGKPEHNRDSVHDKTGVDMNLRIVLRVVATQGLRQPRQQLSLTQKSWRPAAQTRARQSSLQSRRSGRCECPYRAGSRPQPRLCRGSASRQRPSNYPLKLTARGVRSS